MSLLSNSQETDWFHIRNITNVEPAYVLQGISGFNISIISSKYNRTNLWWLLFWNIGFQITGFMVFCSKNIHHYSLIEIYSGLSTFFISILNYFIPKYSFNKKENEDLIAYCYCIWYCLFFTKYVNFYHLNANF